MHKPTTANTRTRHGPQAFRKFYDVAMASKLTKPGCSEILTVEGIYLSPMSGHWLTKVTVLNSALYEIFTGQGSNGADRTVPEMAKRSHA
jgi:hypothetical protein